MGPDPAATATKYTVSKGPSRSNMHLKTNTVSNGNKEITYTAYAAAVVLRAQIPDCYVTAAVPFERFTSISVSHFD